ncbi:MAG: hypothetical protein FWD98_06415 [Defluviitaleaceae bacterium]|nr:hypothetical protein [Defluviitaleaceae bacterium]
MTLTTEQLRQAYFEAIKEYTYNFHNIKHIDDAPLTIRLAVDKMASFFARDGSIQSESISDLSLTFKDVDGLPQDIVSLIAPYCAVRF